jgi:[ribosomal protein S5]-alanine N-acetyltransferase
MRLPEIRTRRLALRPWAREDVDALHALWTMPDMRRYLWDDVVITRDTAEQIVDSHLATAEHHGIGYWTILVPPPRGLVGVPIAGFCGFRFIGDSPDIELMYGLRAEYWGQGLATEACRAAIEYLWRATEFEIFRAKTDPTNERSVRVMRRLGMTHESTGAFLIAFALRRPIVTTNG